MQQRTAVHCWNTAAAVDSIVRISFCCAAVTALCQQRQYPKPKEINDKGSCMPLSHHSAEHQFFVLACAHACHAVLSSSLPIPSSFVVGIEEAILSVPQGGWWLIYTRCQAEPVR